MIAFDQVTYRYSLKLPAVLRNLSLHIEEGELILVIGPSGAGKSTFLRCLNGLVPHFYGGQLHGSIMAAGLDPIAIGPQGMSHAVGMVFQDPETQFVADRVEDELAFGLENQALPQNLMRKRVEEVLDQLSIAHLRNRYISTLSGGEKQRVAIAAVLTTHPQVLVLDEPTSQLDPQSAEEVLVAVRQLNEDLGLTVILAEHRLERVVQFVDRVLYLPEGDEPVRLDRPEAVMAAVSLNPPLAGLGKALGWRPLPLTVKQARRFLQNTDGKAPGPGGSGRVEVDGVPPLPAVEGGAGASGPPPALGVGRSLARSLAAELATLHRDGRHDPATANPTAIRIQDLRYRYPDGGDALRGVTLSLFAGEVVALMGRNGSGKSTLLKLMVGLLKPAKGQVAIRSRSREGTAGPGDRSCAAGHRPAGAEGAFLDARELQTEEIGQLVGYVPQNPGALLFKDTVMEELAFTRQGRGLPSDPQADHHLLDRLGLAEQASLYPRDLSSGQRQRAALAAILVADPAVVLLDEPTRGLDYRQKEALTTLLLEMKAEGRAVMLATHDVELVARCADRVVLLGEGEIVVDGPTREVMTGSLVFASQVNKLFRDPRYLVVEDVSGEGNDRDKGIPSPV